MPRKKAETPEEETTDGVPLAAEGEPQVPETEDSEAPVEVQDEAPADEVQSEDGDAGEPELEPDSEPVGGPEPVEEVPPLEIPEPGALVLVTDANGVEHEALIVREVEGADLALIVCTKDGSDDQLVVLAGTGHMTWRAPA